MQSQPLHLRPAGPRGFQRSPSPAPPLQDTAPLNIRRPTRDADNASPAPMNSIRPPMLGTPRGTALGGLSLAIPGGSASGASTPGKMKLKLALPNGGTAFSGGFFEPPAEQSLSSAVDDAPTERPPKVNREPLTLDTLRKAIDEIESTQHDSAPPEDPSSETPTSPNPPPAFPAINAGLRQPAPPPPPQPPQPVLGSSYETKWSDDYLDELDRLGEGASGAVHLVRDRRSHIIMARKTITTHEAPMKQLLRELQIVSSTSHPNIIHFYGAYISPSSSEVKVLMEWGEGKSLEAVGKALRERGAKISEKVAGRLSDGILQGLAYLHSKKMIHRDIKPANILLNRKGIVKLCDFGVSGELVNSVAGTFTGTSLYMAPERLAGKEYSIRSDVWSSGITLLELVENRYPFPPDLSAIELMMQITQSDPPQLEGDWTDEMKDFIKTMLTFSGTERPTPEDMLQHTWLVKIMNGPKVPMAAWLRQVWGWPEPSRRNQQAAH